MKRVWKFAAPLIVLAGCSKCHRPETTPDAGIADADAPVDAATEAKPSDELRLRPVAFTQRPYFTGGDDHLSRLADGAIVFSHGPRIFRLEPDGGRVPIARIPTPLRRTPIGTMGGFADDLYVSTAEDHYPASTDAHSWRAQANVPPKSILRKDDFYAVLEPWKGGRLLGLRGQGSAFNDNSMFAYEPVAFAVARGPTTGATLPRIPKGMFIEGMIAFPSGAVVAVATKWEGVITSRDGAYALRWRDGATPVVDTLNEDGGVAQVIAARSEDDVWIAGQAGWFQHWDGKTWSHVDSPFSDGFRSIAVTADGALWAISKTEDGGSLQMRAPDGKWTEIDVPTVHTSFDRVRLRMDYDNVRPDRTRDVEFDAPPSEVIASGNDVWVVARTASTVQEHGAALYHWSRTDQPVVDLEEEALHDLEDKLHVAKPKDQCPFFISAGPATQDGIRKAKAAAVGVVVLARSEGTQLVGVTFDQNGREFADEQATKWRALGLPAEVYCGLPAIESFVFDPDDKDAGN